MNSWYPVFSFMKNNENNVIEIIFRDGKVFCTMKTLKHEGVKFVETRVGVIVSDGYPNDNSVRGWSTANSHYPYCFYNPDFIEWIMTGKLWQLMPDAKKVFGPDFKTDEHILRNITIEWVPVTRRFVIVNVAGRERLITDSDFHFHKIA